MNLIEGLGFRYLLPQEQQAYKIILEAFSSMAVSFSCSQINRSVDLMKVIQTVLSDNPSIVYFDKTKIQIESSIIEKRVCLTGVQLKPQAEKMNQSLSVTANLIASSVKATSRDDYSMLTNLYEYLQKNIRYDNDELQANSRGVSSNPAAHNAYGALLNGRAVCDGFSSAFALLAQKLGFECMLVIGKSAYSSTALSNHAWNIIKVQNRFYHMDVTWDTRKYNEFGEFSYAYFALTDSEITPDHEWDKAATPGCSDSDLSYYHKNGLFASNAEQLREIVKSHSRRRSSAFRIKLSRNINLPSNAGEYLVQMLLNEVAVAGRQTQASYGWNENTRCFFAKIIV